MTAHLNLIDLENETQSISSMLNEAYLKTREELLIPEVEEISFEEAMLLLYGEAA